jgi:hypothetical protein
VEEAGFVRIGLADLAGTRGRRGGAGGRLVADRADDGAVGDVGGEGVASGNVRDGADEVAVGRGGDGETAFEDTLG